MTSSPSVPVTVPEDASIVAGRPWQVDAAYDGGAGTVTRARQGRLTTAARAVREFMVRRVGRVRPLNRSTHLTHWPRASFRQVRLRTARPHRGGLARRREGGERRGARQAAGDPARLPP